MAKISIITLKYKNLSIPAKAGLWFTICGFIQKGISFITVPIFTRLLTTEQYGIVSVYNSWLSLVSIFCTLNLFAGGFNNGMLEYEDRRKQYLSAIQGLITSITCAWFVIYFLSRKFWNSLFEMNTALVVVMFAEVLISSALSLWSSRERYEFRYKHLVIVTISNAVFASLFSIVAICLSDSRYAAEAKIVSHALVVFVICGIIYIQNLCRGKIFFDKLIWRNALLFNLPLLPHYLSTMVLNQADRIMISKMVGDSEAGIYSVAYSAAMILNIIVTSINNSFAPWIYGKLKEKDYNPIKRTATSLFAGFSIILAILISFAPEAIQILAGDKYSEAIIIFPSVATSLYFVFMYQIFANVEFYFKKNKFVTYASVTGAILNIFLNYIGISIWGYVAAGYTTLICYAVFGIAHYYFMLKVTNKEIPSIILFDGRTVFALGGGLLLFSIVMNVLYAYTFIRYLILVLIVIAIIINRNKIRDIIVMINIKK